MPARQMTDTPLAPELEAIATAAADRLRAEAEANTTSHDELQRQVAQAASAAIGGAPRARSPTPSTSARRALAASSALMRSNGSRAPPGAGAKPTQSTSRRSSAPDGSDLTHREIANAAEVAHGTVRAILTRTEDASRQPLPVQEPVSLNGGEPNHT
jgi:hypothetical protein